MFTLQRKMYTVANVLWDFENPDHGGIDEPERYKTPTSPEDVAKGEQVGGDTPQKHNSDVTSDLDSKKKSNEKPTIAALSVEEMQKYVDSGKDEMKRVAGMNPDWPPAKGTEAESKIAGDMEQSMTMVA